MKLRCYACSFWGIDQPAGWMVTYPGRKIRPLCDDCLAMGAPRGTLARHITPQEHESFPNPTLANPSRWKEQPSRR